MNAGTSQVLFKCGDLDYHTYRIPSLINIPDGPLIAFCEGRKNNSRDHGDIQIAMRRSFDGGDSWTPIRILLNYTSTLNRKKFDSDQFVEVKRFKDVTCGNPCPVYDSETKRLWLSFNLDNCSLWVTYSEDNGETWSEPKDVTREAFEGVEDYWQHIAAGPGHGIQLSTGRLIVPCDHRLNNDGGFFSMLVVSDDHGEMWKMTEVSEIHMNECEVCELKDGEVYWNMRSYRGKNCRGVSYSEDRGDTFGEFHDDPALQEPVCQASVLRYDFGEKKQKNIVLFSNPASTTRDNMTVKLSFDGAKTWARKLLLYEGPSAYSDLAYNNDGDICFLYERGVDWPYDAIVFQKFSLDWFIANSKKME